MEQNERPLSTADNTRYKVISEEKGKYRIPRLYWLASLGIVAAIWQVAAYYTASELLLPNPYVTLQALIQAICDPEILVNLAITMRRVLTGFAYAALIGIPLGYIMGYSTVAMRMLDPLISSLRQVPIMAWVPLTIVWFGLGDGPTIFLITFAGVFPVIINTIAGVQSISQDYYHAARSMGARPWSILSSIIVPGSLPDILTGLRIALSAGWMSVIWAEFIATSAGFGYSMINAQTMMETDTLIALMIMAAMVGYLLDKILLFVNRRIVTWKYAA